MEAFMSDFHFLRPVLLLLLLLPLFLYWKYYKQAQNLSSWRDVCDAPLLEFLLVKGSSYQRRLIANLALAGVCAAIIGAAGPSWQKKEIPSLSPENPLMILLNVSSDMRDSDLTPNRLERAKYKIRDLLSELHSVQAGLVVYSSEPFLVTPLTEDGELISNLLPEINFDIMPVNGNRLDKALAYAAEKLSGSGYKQGHILVFAPDGGNEFQQALKTAEDVRKQGYQVDVEVTARGDIRQMEILAQKGGGKAVSLSAGDSDIKFWAKMLSQADGDLKEGKNARQIWLDSGYGLTFICLACALYFFRRGVLAVLFLCLLSQPAAAGFFRNADQEGLHLFKQGDYQDAAKEFQDSRWKGASYYKSGNYEQALNAFSAGNSDATALYNQGNALAKGGKIEEAIKKYEEVLEQKPNHEDAKFNLEYLKRQQQQQQQNNSGNGENQDNQEQNQSQSAADSQQNKNDNQENESPENQSSPQESSGEQEAEDKQNDGQEQAGEEKEKSNGENNRQQLPPQESQPKEDTGEDEQNAGSSLQNGEDEPKYDEEAQARAQQYRDIPEDAGGLLKAFIRKEYQARRSNP